MSSERRLEIVLGPPGTGKTSDLTARARKCLESGVPRERLGFVSFSRAAVGEALDRMEGTREQFPWFKTIHALGYALAGVKQEEMLGEEQLREFSERIGEPISAMFAADGSDEARLLNIIRGSPADVALSLYAKAAACDTTPEYEFRQLPPEDRDVDWRLISQIIDKYELFKAANRLWDFSDLVTKSTGVLDADVVFVDEAQDTTRAQWNLLRRAIPRSADLVLAGDDDQCIYRWSGADPRPLGSIRGVRTVLHQSHRVPGAVHQLAARVSGRIPGRIAKSFAARSGDAGRVESVTDLERVDLRTGQWLLLARTRHLASQWRGLAHHQGVVYQLEDGRWSNEFPQVKAAVAYWQLQQGKAIPRAAVDTVYRYLPTAGRQQKTFADIRNLPDTVTWEDVVTGIDRTREWWKVLEMDSLDVGYIRQLRRNGESLTQAGRVRISTAHRAKGLEADNVGVLMALPRRVAISQDKFGDELRVLYVALTRARHRLVLAYTPTPHQWRIP